MSSGYYLTAPFYYFNLGCHMVYILRNRLEAQSVRKEKHMKILQDITNSIFKENFIQSLVVPQDPFNVNSLKDIFSRLAHSSIMKLDQSSMDKLFYLMLMSVKKEIFLLSSPLELYTLTLSHLLNVTKYLENTNAVQNLKLAIEYFRQVASKYSFIQFLQIQEYLLSELQGFQTKIVNFIESGSQISTGKLVFRLRNGHNQKSIGSALNQNEIDFTYTFIKPEVLLFYNSWMNWKTSLVIDFVEDYKKASQRRNSKQNSEIKNTKQGQKSLSDLLNIQKQKIDEFEVKFDIFETATSGGDLSQNQIPSYQASKKQQTVKQSNTSNNTFKAQIQKQFSDLKVSKQQEEDLDLLEMMDN